MNNLQELYKEYSAIYPDVPEDMFYLSLQDEGGNIIEKSLNSVINEIYDVKKKDRTTPTGSIVPEQILEQFRGVPQNQIDTRYQQPTTQPTQPPLFSPPLEGSGEEIFPQDFSVPMGSETDLALLDSESLSTPQTANSQQSRLKDETISQTPFTASESTNTEFSGTENLPSSSIPNSSVELEATPPITDDITAEDLKLMASIPAQQNPLKDTTVIFQDGEPMAVFQRLPAQERSIQTLAGKSDIQDGMFSDINPLGINIGSNVLAGQDPRADAMLDYIKQQEETERKNYGNYWHGLIPDIDDIPEIKPRDFNKTTIFNADKIRDVSAGSIENPISVNEGNEKLITDEKNGIRERVKYNEFNNKWGADTINIDGYAASVSGRFLYRIKDDNLLKNTQNEENIFAENYNERVRNANEKNREANTINSKINDDNILYRGAGLLKDPPKSEADQYISDLQSKYEIILTEEQKNSLYTQQGRDTLEISLEFAKRKKENPNIDDNTLYNQIIKERQSEILSPEEKQRIGKQYISDLFDDGRMLQAINNGYADALKLTQDDVKEYQFYNQYFSSPQNVQDFGDFMNDEGRYLFDTSAVKNFFSGSSQRARRNVFNAFLDWRSKQERLDLEFSKRGFEQAEYRISNSGENTAQLENANADREKYLDAFASAIIEKQNKEKDYAYLESAFVTTAKEDSEREDLLLRARNGDSAAKTKIFLGNLALGVGTSLQDGLTGIGRIVVSPFGSDNANDLLDEFSNPLTIGNVQIAGISNEVNKYRYNGNSYEEIDGVLFQVGANGKRFKPQEAPPTYDMELISSERSLNYTGIAFITSKMATDILVTNKVGGRTNTVFGNTARTLRNTKLATRVFGETSQITKNLTALQKAQRAGFTGWYVQMYNGNYQAAKEGGITSELGRHLYAGFNSYLTALLSKINPDVNFLKTVNSESRAIVAHLMNNRLDAGLVGARSLLNKIISTSGSELGEEFAQQLTQDLTNFFTNIYGNKNLQISTVGDYKDTFYATIIPSAIIALFGGRMNPRNVTIGDKTIDIRNYSQSELMTELSRTDGGIQILEAYRDNATSEREKETLDELVKEANTRKKLIDKIPDVQNKTTKALTDIQPLMQKIAKLDADIRNDDGTFEARLKAERDGVIKQINDILDAGDATYGETQSTGGTSQQSQTGNEQPQPQTEEVYTTETPQPETQPSPQSQTSQENQNIWQRAKEKISNLFDFALNNRSEYDWENIGNVTQERAEKINDATGLQITEDYQHVIESNFINHVLKEHGNEKIENQRGQTAITKNDFEKIPEILDAFDNVEHVGKNSYGLDVIRYSKEFEDGTTYYLEEVRNGRNKLAAATMYKKRKPSDNLMNQSSSAATSETNPDAPSFEIGQPLTRSDAENSTSNLTSETLRNPLSENRSANMPTAETVPNRLTSETTSTANIQNIPEIQRIGDKIINGDTNWTPEDEQFRLNNSQEIEQYLNEQQNNSQQNENTQTQQTQPQTETASGTATPPLQPQRATDETTENQATQNIRQNDETNVEETQPENQETLTEDDIDFDTLLQGLIDAENQTLEENVISTREEKGFVWRRYADGSEDITSPKGTIITPFIYAKPAKNRISRQAQSPRRVSNAQFAWNKAKIFGDKTNAQHKREYAKRMREALNFTASTNERNAALLYFANGGKVSTESIKKELNNNVEQYKWAWFGKNNANSIETVSEKIWGNNPHLDRTVIRDELIDVINSYSSSTDIREEILSLYNQANDPYFGFTEDDAYEMWKAEASPREIALADEIRAEEQMPEDVRFEYYRQQYKNSIHSLSDAEQEQYYREIYETDFGRNERVQPQNEGVQSSASGVVGGTQESGGDSQNVAGTASQTQSEQVRQQSKTSQRPFKSITKKAFDGLINLLKATGLARNVIIDKNAMRKRFGESGFKAYQAVTATAKANAQWNADLDRFKNGELPTNVVLSLGTPQGILRAAGINENEITLKQSVLEAKLEQHNLTTDELKNLASAIQNPILVYEWGTKAKSNVIITDLTRENGEKITVAIKAERKGNALEVNDIASIHGKSAERTLSDFTKAVGENATRPLNEILKYVNKEKALNWLTNSAPMAQSSNQGVNSVANIINSHENPKIDEDFLRMFSVYHGSPYSFDKFSSSQIGTGEGAQGYGYGLYFTDLEDVAKDYAKKLADRKLGLLNPNFEQSTWDNAPLTEVLKNNYDKFFIQSLHNSRNTAEYRNTVNTAFRDVRLKKPNGFEQQRKWIIDAIDSGKIKVAEVEPEGNLYKVKIHGDKTIEELNFIRWDKPLKARERQRLSELLYNEVVKTPEHQGNEDNVKRIINEEFDGKFNFGEIYGFITSWLGGSNVNASNFLLRSGIDGIQYPTYYQNDPSDKDTYNYVVFDENAIEIQEHIRLMATPNGEVYGFVTPEGDIYLDPENLNANTPIHEFGHLWNDYAKKNNPKLYNKGVELIKNSTYWQKVNDNPAYAHLSDEQKADEALAMAIGDKGEQIYQDQKTGFVAWLRDLWNWIRGNNPNPEIRNLNSDQIQNLTLEQFVSGAATDLLSGEQMATSPQSQSSQNITRTQSNVEYANQSDYDFDVSGITKENAQEMQRIKTVAQANGTFMLAPNGQPTNLNEREWLQVRTKNFIKWFGDWINKPINASKIVDENGEPMRVYHGTDEAFTEFDFSNWRRSSDASGKGFYFTPNEKTARGFGRHMMPVFLNIKNPFVGWSSLDADTRKNLEKKEGVWEDALRETGFDGDLTKNDIFAAFNPAQIKSATSNNGNFDEQQDDIRFNVLPNQQSPQANQSPLTESDRTQNSDIRFQATRSNNNSISKLEAQRVLSATKTGGIAAGYTALQETDWYKNLSRAEKNRITQNNFMNAVIQNMQQQTLITERIKPEVRTNTQPPKKINQIIADAAKNLGSTLIYGKAMRRNAAGSYNPSLALVRIKNAGDIDTVAHELGHFIDDKFDFLGNINPANTANIEIELKWFSDRGGSKPSANLSKEKKQEYLKREGLAEFIRAYIVNPQAAQQKAPNLYQELEQILDDKAKKALKDFSDDFISFANATSGGMITANVNDSTLKNKTEFLNFRKKTDGFGFSLWDNINSAIFDSAAKANKAFAYINKLAGDKKLLPEKDFRLLYRVFAGINGKIDTILRSGLTDGRNNRLFTSGIEKEINEANTQWNKQLDDFKAGKLHSSATLNLGKPQETLKAAGINEIEITLKQSILSEKLEQHGLTTDELKNLADAIQNPILVYEWGTKAKSNVIITDLTRENGEKITVAIKAERKGNALEVNDIASIHGKSAERFLSDMVNAKEGGLQEALRFVDKEKALDWLTIDPPKGSGSNKGLNENTPNWLGNPTERGTPTNPELLSIANIIQNFENPKVGEKMTMEWLLGSFDTTSPETVRADKEDTIRLLIAQRTVEYAQKFGRTDQLTGIGGGIKTDLDVAQEFLNEFNELQNTNPEKYERITEAARRYREYADAGLKYAVDKGRLSEEDYQRIKNNNEYYVNLARVKELSPTEEQNPIFSSGGSVTSVRDIFKKAKGGTDVIQDPFISLLINTANIIRDSDRNEVMRSFIEPLKNVREMGDGEPIEFGEIARPAGSGETNVKTIYVNGVAERWQFSSDTIDAFDDLQSKSDELIYKVFKSPADLIRFTVTHFPVFALRNVTRDTASRLIQSRTDSKFKEMIHNASDEELLALYGGSLSRRFSNGKNDHLIELEAAIRKLTGNKNSIVINPRALWKGYKNLLQKGENINRIAEFKAAYKKAKKEGLDDYNAQLYAAFEARDLMDFAVSGTAIRELNKFIPFLNAGVQGLVRTKKSFTERPLATLAKIAIYSVIPQLIVRMINGDDEDEEYNQLPDYQRDLFWNIKLKGTSTWISIPKPYDVGIFSSLVDRAVDKIKGYDNAFDGLIGSALKTLVPIDESNFLGMFKPIVETMTNYDFFRENTIVNQWEVGKMRELRKGDNDASRISKGITDLIYKTGMDINPKKLDHFIKGYTSYMGDFILRAGDIGKEDSRFKFGVSQTGFAKESPISNAKSVTQAYDLAESTGNLQRKEIKKLRDGIKRYYLLEDEKEKEQLRKKIYNYSKDLVERLKKREQENKK